MKKIIAIVISLLLICSCTVTVTTDEIKSKESVRFQRDCELVEIEFDGHKHEFVFYHNTVWEYGGIAHWPDCKYCKQHGSYYSY
jgi:uncharacterized protein YxeA